MKNPGRAGGGEGRDKLKLSITFVLEGQTISVTFRCYFFRGIREVAVYSGGADACLLTRRAVAIRSSAGSFPMRVQDAVTRKLIRILEETRYKKR